MARAPLTTPRTRSTSSTGTPTSHELQKFDDAELSDAVEQFVEVEQFAVVQQPDEAERSGEVRQGRRSPEVRREREVRRTRSSHTRMRYPVDTTRSHVAGKFDENHRCVRG
jgi:hypothetical protein